MGSSRNRYLPNRRDVLMSGISSGITISFTIRISGAAELEDITVDPGDIIVEPGEKNALFANIVTDYGAVGDGITNNATAFKNFQTWAQAQTLPITLTVPEGAYVQGTNWMQGIDNLTVIGPATFADNRRVGGGGQQQTAQKSLRLEAVSEGDTVLMVKNVDPARLPVSLGDPTGNPNRDLATLMALVSEGDWVLLSAWDTMGYGYPTNPQVFEYAQVASVDAGAGTITLTAATRNAYPDTYPVYWNGATLQQATNISGLSGTFQAGELVTASGGATGLEVHSYPSNFNGATDGVRFTLDSLVGKSVAAGETLTGQTSGATATVVATGTGLGNYRNFEADQGGPATLYVLDPSWDTQVTLRDLTWPTLASGQVAMAGRSLKFENVDFTGMTATPNSLWPSAAKTLTFTDCDMNAPEHDKLVETLTIRRGSATTHIVQSAGIDRMVIEDHTCNNINGTVRNTEIRNTTVSGTVKISPAAYGRSDSVVIENSSAATLTWNSRAVLLADVTFDAGVFSKSDAGFEGVAVFGREWAVPGTRIALSNSSGQVLDIATIMAFSELGGTASVTTDLAELPAGADRIYPHPCWDVTASGNTGALAVLNGSTNQPLFSHAKLTGTESMTLWGQLAELRVNVTETYKGDLTITGPARTGTWTAKIDLSKAGERIITGAGVTGAQVGDMLPDAGWFQGAFTVLASGGTFTIDATTDQTASPPVEEEPAVTSQTIGYYPMDEATGDFQNAVYPSTYLKRNDPDVTQVIEANGLVLARTQDKAGGDAIIGSSADGIMLAGERPWCVHGFFRWRNSFTTNNTLLSAGAPSAWSGGPLFKWNSHVGVLRLSLLNGSGSSVNLDMNGVPTNNSLLYVAYGWDGKNAFIKRSSDGATWVTQSVAMPENQMEIAPYLSKISSGGAAVDLGKLCITRDIPSEADLTWFANGMAGRATSEVTDRLGSWPELQELPATVQTGGGTTWDGTTLLTHTGWLKNTASVADDLYWCKPYHLRGMNSALADSHGDYVWFMSSDHSGGGIVVGFSEDPSVPPASWERIWAAGASGEPGAKNADISGYHVSSETPCLVYNPDDVNGRPFWLYYHDMGRSVAENDGSTGYNSPQETRLITSNSLLRGSWVYEKTVLPVRNYHPNQVFNHRGYAVVVRNGPDDWEAWHLGADRSDHTYARSTSTDGRNWNMDWFIAPPDPKPYYRRWNQQQFCPPGLRLEAPLDIFTFRGQRYVLSHMNRANSARWSSFRDPNKRYVCIAPLGSDGFISGPPIILYEATGQYYDAADGSYNSAERAADHDGYIQSTKCHLDGSTLHLYIKHRYKAPSFIVYATVDLSPLAG
ncbi:hypothetical protein [Roseitranquillus sediminis]|uniref:hypothetical protein n=1 Tax=Roseitranquillus sediminis TaxID=2809051 RepID=UPI001D0CAD95|nr:hypothetical protein [Roseitranquillus sediminis]MBM9594039.1 hypothetical protein [Roseitranquillus sediminis]